MGFCGAGGETEHAEQSKSMPRTAVPRDTPLTHTVLGLFSLPSIGAFGSTPLGIHGLRILSLACGVVALALIAFAGMQSFHFGQTLGVTPEGKLSLGSWLVLIEVAALAFVCASFITIVHCRRWLIGLAFALLALPYVLMTMATFIGAASASRPATWSMVDVRAYPMRIGVSL
jgi:hypothetical protein